VSSTRLPAAARFQRPEFDLATRVREVADAVAHPERGRVVALARRHGISRQHASSLVNTVRRAMTQALQARAPGRPPHHTVIEVDRQRIEDAVLALTLDARASIDGAQACLQTILDTHVATGRISAIRHEAIQRAAEVMAHLPAPAAPIHAVSDELYDHGRPVLVLMDDEQLGVLLAAVEEEADATTWGVHLLDLKERGLQLAGLVSDQGSGMCSGVSEAGVVPDGAHGADTFHFQRDIRRYLSQLRHDRDRARRRLNKLTADLDYQTQPRRGRGHPRRPTSLEAYEQAVDQARTAAQRYQDAKFLIAEVEELLQPVDREGRLIPEQTARDGIQTAAELLRQLGPSAASIATLLEGAQDHVHAFRAPLADSHAELCHRYGSPLVQFVAWTWRHRKPLRERLPRCQAELAQRWGLDASLAAITEIWDTFRNCHRASSVLEGFNAELRAHVRAHRGLRGLLPLIVFRHNVRRFPRGLHRGQAPFVSLGILPPDDRGWIQRLRDLATAPAPSSHVQPVADPSTTPVPSQAAA